MWVNTKPYTSQLYSPTAVPYTVGISSTKSLIDQKRNLIHIKPGYQISIKVLPKIVETTTDFNALDMDVRKCKLGHETDGFNFLLEYTRAGCEFECAAAKAMTFCKCIPWYYANSFEDSPMCDMFGGFCFDKIMSEETNYKKCSTHCLEECEEMALTVLPSIFPLDIDDICMDGSFFYLKFKHSFRQHFAFQSYKTIVEEGSVPDLASSFSNGSFCKHYILSYISLVSVESPTSSVIKSKREKRISFNDQLGTIGGTLGLFTGMSLLSMVEVLFFFLSLIMAIFVGKRDKRNSIGDSSHNELGDQNTKTETCGKCNIEIQKLHVSFVKYKFGPCQLHTDIFAGHESEFNQISRRDCANFTWTARVLEKMFGGCRTQCINELSKFWKFPIATKV